MGEVVRMLWIGGCGGGRLPAAQAACVASFVGAGHAVELFCYEELEGVPWWVRVRDAREIMAEGEVFAYGPAAGRSAGSLAACSNIFRYELLLREGGYWVDTDVYCVRELPREEVVIAGERTKTGEVMATNCVMRLPAGHELAARCLEESRRADRGAIRFGEIGPRLVDRVVGELGLRGVVRGAEVFCPVDWMEYRRAVEVVGAGEGVGTGGGVRGRVPEGCCGVHLWNEMWRMEGGEIPWGGGGVEKGLAQSRSPQHPG